jgi:hypothetical protein
MNSDGWQTPASLARHLDDWGHDRGWKGADPYEGLNARSGGARLLKRSPFGRRLLIQAVKRSPIDLRRVLRVPPELNSAAVAQVASAYARGGFRERETELSRLREMLALLDGLRCRDFAEPCWGYPFDVQSRVVFYARGTPNVIATCFAGSALLDAYEQLGDEALLAGATETGRFLIRHIPQTQDGDGAFFGYFPGDRSPIHNSSMLVAALLARLAGHGQETDRFASAAETAVIWTTGRQRDDGSWPYGERADLAWVDNFHTGYILDALRACSRAGIAEAHCERAYGLGLEFFRHNLLLEDGAPSYYATRNLPYDGQCVAQSIQTLSIAGDHDPDCTEQARRTFEFAERRMLRGDGLPIFQRRRLWANRVVHVRWVVAPLLNALTCLIAAARVQTTAAAAPEVGAVEALQP